MSEPIAQGPNAGPEGQPHNEQQSNVEAPKQDPFAGIQSRIDQLTAKYHESEARVQAKDEQINNLVQQLIARQSTPAEQDPYAGIEVDPQQRELLDRVLNNKLSKFEQIIQRQDAMLRGMAAASQVEAAVAGKQVAPEVVAKAKQLVQAWNQSGLQGWKPEDALIYAAGQLALNGGQQPRNAQGQFTGQSVLGPSVVPSGVPNQQRSSSAPLDFNKPLDKQIDDLANRLGDNPF